MTDLSKLSDTLGYAAFIPATPQVVYLHNQRIGKLEILQPDRLDIGFLQWLLRTPSYRAEVLASATGTTVKHTAPSRIQAYRFALPTLSEQRAITAVLSALDDRIDLIRRRNETLDEVVRAIFKSWFVDFDAVQAKAGGRLPFGMDATTAALFPGAFESSSLGEIPQGWRAASLAAVATLNPESWTKPTYPDSIEYVDLANTKWGTIEAIRSYSKEGAPSRAQRVLRKGDTIVGTVRPGNGSFALVMQRGLTGSTGFAVLRPRWPNAVGFVYLSATRRENIMTLAHLADGGAYPAVRPEVVIQQPAAVPPDAVLSAFAGVVDPMLERCAQADVESQCVVELRDYLLPRLISGEICVRDAERVVGAAT
jgi:type I restriction enzyme S subunit